MSQVEGGDVQAFCRWSGCVIFQAPNAMHVTHLEEKLTGRSLMSLTMPGRSKSKSTFNTLAREELFRNPSAKGSTIPILNEFVAPHIESFNALFDDSGLPSGDGDGRGLLSLGVKDIGERVAFDGNGKAGTESGETGWGNRMSSKHSLKAQNCARLVF